MSATDENLINLRPEEDHVMESSEEKHFRIAEKFENDSIQKLSTCGDLEIFDNNPFDILFKQVNLPDDPFEMLPQKAASQTNVITDAKTEDLLNMSKDNSHFSFPPSSASQFGSVSNIFNLSINSNDSVFCATSPAVSSNCTTSEMKDESPKTPDNLFNLERTIDTCDSNNSEFTKMFRRRDSDGSAGSSGCKLPIVGNDRIQLLKMSLSNSSCSNSPLLRQQQQPQSDESFETSVFKEAGKFADRISQSVLDSPKISEDSCEDLMKIKPNWIDSETDIDSDLESMNIPILRDIENYNTESPKDYYSFHQQQKPFAEEPNSMNYNMKTSGYLETIKKRVNSTKNEENTQNVGELIQSIKKIVLESENESKKLEANILLEHLSNLLEEKETSVVANNQLLPEPPQPFIRQGTFDLDPPKQNDDKNSETIIASDNDTIDCGNSTLQPSESVTNIVEQIGKMLENQNVNVLQANLGNSGPGIGSNPTYIVVMNTPLRSGQQKVHFVDDNNVDDGQEDISPELPPMRTKRSQSLSLHDKPTTRLSFSKPINSPTPYKPSSILNRRNSVCASPGITNTINNRRLINPQTFKETNLNRKSFSMIKEKQVPSKIVSDLDTKKLRVKTNESNYRQNGPIKATIPIKKVAPMVTVSTPIEDGRRMKFQTSTPNEHVYSKVMFPNTSTTTPTADMKITELSSPVRNRSRYSYMSATPNPRSTLGSSSSSNYIRKRTLSELKSPKKGIGSVKNSGISKQQMKTLRLPNNFATTNSNFKEFTAIKNTLGQKRLSLQGKNKENNRPDSK